MTEPMEKVKRKSKSRVDRYSQNEAFAVMVFSLAGMLFFWLDELIGAVALKQYEFWILLATSIGVPFAYVHLNGRWEELSYDRTWLYSILAAIAGGTLFFVYAIFTSILSGTANVACTPALFFLLILFAIANLVRPDQIEAARCSQFLIERISLIFLVASLIFALVSFQQDIDTTYSNEGYVASNSANYFLIVEHSNEPDSGFPTKRPILYECNQLSIECKPLSEGITYFRAGSFRRQFNLVQGEHDNVLVLVDGEVVFDSSEGSE